MAISIELATRKLADIFGDDETTAFLKEASSKPGLAADLIDVVLTMYDAYGPQETHEIFDALHLEVPHLEDRMRSKGAKQLAHFRSEIWEHQFPENSPLNLIQMGINQIVLYPIQTELGGRLLACMVATAWNPKNLDYFDVYSDLRYQSETMGTDEARKIDPTVSFIIDHAAYESSNPDFNRENGPGVLSHLHPISSDGYQIHIYYHWNFPGLMAMQSILHFIHRFIDNKRS